MTICALACKISPAFGESRRAARVCGDIAQLGEHRVRNAGVTGSNPAISTIKICKAALILAAF